MEERQTFLRLFVCSVLPASIAPGFRPTVCGEVAARLERWHQGLEQILRSLAGFLDAKRAGFARFFFLADDEIVEVLTAGRTPFKIHVGLQKCADQREAGWERSVQLQLHTGETQSATP